MKLKKLSNLGQEIIALGKEFLSKKLSNRSTRVQAPPPTKADDLQERVESSNRLAKKFEIPDPNNEIETSRQQSMLDSQGLPNQTEAYGQGNSRQTTNSNMGQRNFDNHQQNET